jgi:MFS family permease
MRPISSIASSPLFAVIAAQIFLHGCMTGLRMAAPLAALRLGHSAWEVGVVLSLFAVGPIFFALRAGRLADKYGFHRPMRVAAILAVAAAALALSSTWIESHRLVVLCLAAALSGAGTNFGAIAIQRTAGRMADDPVERRRVFSWLGLAPAIANVVGPVLAGILIDLSGFALAFGVLMLLPLASLAWARGVPVEMRAAGAHDPERSAWELLASPALRRLLLVNWALASAWDVHTFLVPILGHERGFSASAIGLVLGVFAACVAAVRVVIPMLAHRVREAQVLVGAMLWTAAVLALYPFVHSAWLMGLLAGMLGLSLGAVQPMIMTSLHQITPRERHGEAIALRSMVIHVSSALMPMAFGVAGAVVGASGLFWMMGALVGAGSLPARRVGS